MASQNSSTKFAWGRSVLIVGSIVFVAIVLIRQMTLWLLSNDSDKTLIEALIASSTAATAIAVIISAVAAYLGYQETREATKNRTSFEVIFKLVHDQDLIGIFGAWRSIKVKYDGDKDGVPFDDVHRNYKQYQATLSQNGIAHTDHVHEYDIIISLLNYYEAIAIGIKDGAINEEIIKDWWRQTTVRDWTLLYQFVSGYRKERGSSTIYEHAEDIVNSWAVKLEEDRLERLRADFA